MAKPVPVLASTDLSSISRRSKSCVTTVSILEPNMDWLTLGEAHLIRKNSDRGWSLDAYGLEGITDFEHDSIKIMSLPLIGVELKHVYYHTTVLLAWVIPNLGPFQEFHVPRSGYDPLQNGKRCDGKSCGTGKKHWIAEKYIPAFDADLYRLVQGRQVQISIGSSK